mmetsp:Transcript_9520/g.28638  ORF Transcript_9520/g.28638 Transcript_9520/m.28638 type:complete len:229 (+) Transcript_9520:302-988(+)
MVHSRFMCNHLQNLRWICSLELITRPVLQCPCGQLKFLLCLSTFTTCFLPRLGCSRALPGPSGSVAMLVAGRGVLAFLGPLHCSQQPLLSRLPRLSGLGRLGWWGRCPETEAVMFMKRLHRLCYALGIFAQPLPILIAHALEEAVTEALECWRQWQLIGIRVSCTGPIRTISLPVTCFGGPIAAKACRAANSCCANHAIRSAAAHHGSKSGCAVCHGGAAKPTRAAVC